MFINILNFLVIVTFIDNDPKELFFNFHQQPKFSGKKVSVHDMDSTEELELRLKQKIEEVR